MTRLHASPNVKRTLIVALAVMLAAACGGQAAEHRVLDLTTANFASPADLANSSEYVVTATLTGTPKPYTLPDEHALRYWVAPATITSVVAQRPDVRTKLAVGMSIPIGTQLLNSADSKVLSNYSDLAKTFPTEQDIPSSGDKIVAFLVHEDMTGFGDGYQAVGQAKVGPSAQATLRALPGTLNHRGLTLKQVTTDIASLMRLPAPWRSTPSEGATIIPPSTGAPASTGAPGS